MLLSQLLKNIHSQKIIGTVETQITDVQFDSRKIEKGNLFAAVQGTDLDGHKFIHTAIEKGAEAVLCELLPENLPENITFIQVKNSAEALGIIACNRYNNPSKKLKLVGVTGTNGKTTTATLLYEIFRKLGYGTGLLSTVCNYINDIAFEATHTTPDPLELNQLLAGMVSADCSYCFMEVSSHAIDQRRIAGLNFVGGIFTNLTRDHIDYHLTFDNYLKVKKCFFDHLPANAFALTNLDDKNGLVILQNTKAKKYTYSLRTLADFKTKILEHDFHGMLLEMNGMEIYVPFIGQFNACNLTAILGAAQLLGADYREVWQIISVLHSVSGRFETLWSPHGYTVIVDYAHTPDALENVISTINDILQNTEGRLITVAGCGGNRDKGKRPIMARVAVNGSFKAILTSDNPRNEEPQDILNDMLTGLDEPQKQKSLVIIDRREAIKTACSLAQKGDVVLVAGKGHEDYQIIKGVKHYFDDREEVRKLFV